MSQHTQRFDSVGAQKGTALHSVVDALKRVAAAIEKRYDPNSPEVIGAMQRMEQALGLLTKAPTLIVADTGGGNSETPDTPTERAGDGGVVPEQRDES